MPYPSYSCPPDNLITNHDISLRDTFNDMLYGTVSERPRGRVVVIQSLLRDADRTPIKSPYVYKDTKEGKDKDRGPNTTRTGYLCNESFARTLYRPASRMIMDERTSNIGKQVPTRDICYFSYKNPIYEQDVVVFIGITDEGYPVSPIYSESELTITKVYPKYLDNGRIEYYAAIVEEQK